MANDQISESMFITAIVQCLICSFGLALNGFLAIVIIRNKKLRFYCCGFFLMILAIYDSIAEFFLVFLSTPLTIFQITIPLLTCFWLDFYCVYAQNNAQLLMCSISIDRLISILFPVSYKRICSEHKFKYIAAFLIPPAIYVSYLVILFYNYSIANSDKPVYCMPSDYVDAMATKIMYNVLMYSNLVMIAVYSLIWILLKAKGPRDWAEYLNMIFAMIGLKIVKIKNSADYRIYKSWIVLMLVTFFCWLPVPLLITFVFPSLQIQMSANIINDLQRALLQLNKAAQAINAPILFICSSQYRKAMRKEMKRFVELVSKKQNLHISIVPI